MVGIRVVRLLVDCYMLCLMNELKQLQNIINNITNDDDDNNNNNDSITITYLVFLVAATVHVHPSKRF